MSELELYGCNVQYSICEWSQASSIDDLFCSPTCQVTTVARWAGGSSGAGGVNKNRGRLVPNPVRVEMVPEDGWGTSGLKKESEGRLDTQRVRLAPFKVNTFFNAFFSIPMKRKLRLECMRICGNSTSYLQYFRGGGFHEKRGFGGGKLVIVPNVYIYFCLVFGENFSPAPPSWDPGKNKFLPLPREKSSFPCHDLRYHIFTYTYSFRVSGHAFTSSWWKPWRPLVLDNYMA